VGRVAVVNDVAGVGTLQVAALRQAGWEADLYDVRKPAARWPSWAKLLAAPIRLALYVPIVVRLRRGRYDLVHVHFVSHGVVGAASGRPYFLQAHGSDLHLNLKRPLLRWWSRKWMRGARAIFYVTPNLAVHLVDFQAKSVLLPNPIDLARFAVIPAPDRIENALIFMRLEPVKGAERVFADVPEVAQSVALTAIDSGPLAAEYKQRHGDHVRFINPVAHADVPALLARFDAVIGQMAQGVAGLSELEAMAAGRIVLMAIDQRLYAGDAPPVVGVSAEHGLVERLRALRTDTAELRRISAAGRAWMEAHHSLQAHAQTLVRAYRSALTPAPRPIISA
jgi:glycosyltransferase involved in cell wall biosynthesis